jgi:hypothetical protein
MKKIISKIILATVLILSFTSYAQEDDSNTKSNIQTYTPSKLLNKGQWDIKFFNNLYTQTKSTGADNSTSSKIDRQTFFTSTVEVFTGISENSRINVGAIIEYRSNTFGGQSTFSPFNFEDSSNSRNGFSSIAPSVKIQPFKNISNFSFQSALHIPVISKGDDSTNVFLDQSAWSFQNRFFYDYTLPSGDWQLFTELNTEYGFGDEDSFANKTFLLAPGVFMSYFPSNTTTVLGFVQHSQRLGDFEQNSTSLGFGGKIQLNETLNLEALYSNIVRGHNFQGLGNSFSVGIRALF